MSYYIPTAPVPIMVTRWGGDEAEHGAGKKKRIIFLWLILIQGKNTNHHQSSNVWPHIYTNKIYTSCGHLYRRTLTLAMLPPGSDWRVRRARSPPPLMCPGHRTHCVLPASHAPLMCPTSFSCSSYVSRTHIVSHQLLIRWALYRRLRTFGFLLKYNALQPLLLVSKILKIAVN